MDEFEFWSDYYVEGKWVSKNEAITTIEVEHDKECLLKVSNGNFTNLLSE